MSDFGTKTPKGNSRIYNCYKCDKAFTREEHLSRHVLSTHNKLKPFICGICSRPFSRRDLLLRHAKNLHQGLEKSISRIRKLKKQSSNYSDSNDTENESEGIPLKNVELLNDNETLLQDDKPTEQSNKLKMSVNMLIT